MRCCAARAADAAPLCKKAIMGPEGLHGDFQGNSRIQQGADGFAIDDGGTDSLKSSLAPRTEACLNMPGMRRCQS